MKADKHSSYGTDIYTGVKINNNTYSKLYCEYVGRFPIDIYDGYSNKCCRVTCYRGYKIPDYVLWFSSISVARYWISKYGDKEAQFYLDDNHNSWLVIKEEVSFDTIKDLRKFKKRLKRAGVVEIDQSIS